MNGNCENYENYENYENCEILLDRYKIIRYLQKGTYGKVSLAKDLITNQQVSIKSIPIKYKSFAYHEIKILKLLVGNENICQLITDFKHGNSIFLVLEYCSNGDLHDFLRKGNNNPSINSSGLYQIADQLYNAITFAHARGVYHRDLKPENILLSEKNVVKLCDWGLATTDRINQEFNVGTEKYMAPEVFINNYNKDLDLKYYDAKFVDYWSFGMTLITILFGKTPFETVDGKSLIHDSNFKKFLLFNQKEILFDIYPNLNLKGFKIFNSLFKINGIDDNLENFLAKIKQRNIHKFMNDLRQNYRSGLTIDEEDDVSNYNDIKIDLINVLVPKLNYSLKPQKEKSSIQIVENEILVDDFTNLNWFDY